jgi:small multidrug resistance family-3 protein
VWATLRPHIDDSGYRCLNGGIYIFSSLLWLWGVENTPPDHRDFLRFAVCLIGTAIILSGPQHYPPPFNELCRIGL